MRAARFQNLQRRMNCICCQGDVLREICSNQKYAVLIILILVLFLSVPITALIISTGKYWKCPGEPRTFSWSLGFGIMGVLYCWFWIVMIIQSIICDGTHDRRLRYTTYVLVTFIFLVLSFAWALVGFGWLNLNYLKDTYYYVNGKNLYCHQLVRSFGKAMPWLTSIYFIVLPLIIGSLKFYFSD